MMTLRTLRPSGSYVIELAQDVREQYDGRVGSFWQDGKPLLLQVSSYLRAEGSQVGALDRLQQRMESQAENWKVWKEKLHPEPSVDQATAEALDEGGVLWIHSYLVWPHLTIYTTVSGPEAEVRKSNSWAIIAVRSLRLAVH